MGALANLSQELKAYAFSFLYPSDLANLSQASSSNYNFLQSLFQLHQSHSQIFWKNFLPGDLGSFILNFQIDPKTNKRLSQLMIKIKTVYEKYPPFRPKILCFKESLEKLSEGKNLSCMHPMNFFAIPSIFKIYPNLPGIKPETFIKQYGERLTAEEFSGLFTGEKAFPNKILLSAPIMQAIIQKCSVEVVEKMFATVGEKRMSEKTFDFVVLRGEEFALKIFQFLIHHQLKTNCINDFEHSFEKYLLCFNFSQFAKSEGIQKYFLRLINEYFKSPEFQGMQYYLFQHPSLNYLGFMQILNIETDIPIITLGKKLQEGETIHFSELDEFSFFPNFYIYLAVFKNYPDIVPLIMMKKNFSFMEVDLSEAIMQALLMKIKNFAVFLDKDIKLPELKDLYKNMIQEVFTNYYQMDNKITYLFQKARMNNKRALQENSRAEESPYKKVRL
ncbi:MAG: hypothetical protein Tsb0015_17300 [Simkaniaceae bacterium]